MIYKKDNTVGKIRRIDEKDPRYADTKKWFIARLDHFVRTEGKDTPDGYGRIGYQLKRGTLTWAAALARWLEDPLVPSSDRGLNWCYYLHHHLVAAFEDFSRQERFALLRAEYKEVTDYDIPDLVDSASGGTHRVLLLMDLCKLMSILADEEWLEAKLEQYFNAERWVVDQAWRRFVRRAYGPFMERIKAESHRANSGTFGKTILLTYAMAGRVMFTFTRGPASMTYVADDGDPVGVRSGSNATSTPYEECVSMIREVTDAWDMGIMRPDPEVGLG